VYWDDNGFIHHNKEADSENGILFLSYWYTLFTIASPPMRVRHIPPDLVFINIATTLTKWLVSNNGQLRTKNNDENDRFSHDNVSGLLALNKLIGANYHTSVHLFRRYSIRPDNFFFFVYAKYPLIGWFFIWIPCLAMIISSMREKRNGDLTTSGKLLLWLKCTTFNFPITLAICEYFIFRQKHYDNWADVFAYYFKETAHPINLLAEEIYGPSLRIRKRIKKTCKEPN